MKINWFQVAIAVLQAAAAVVAFQEGRPVVGGLMLTYVIANLFLAVL